MIARSTSAQNADHQDALLVFLRHREVCEQHQEHKDVVDGKGLLDQVAREELERFGIRHRLQGRVVTRTTQVPPHPAHEQEAHRHPDQGPDGCLAHANLVGALLLQRKEING
jgi:hypothetical protein